MQFTMRGVGALISGTALTIGALTVNPAAQAATHDDAPLEQGIDWITGRLHDGTLSTQYGPGDYSTTGYLAIALQRIGGHDAQLAPMIAALEAHPEEQIHGYVGGTDVYAGSAAKLAVAVQGAGDDPTDVDGVDLIETLEGQTKPDGRTFDTSEYGDYANTIGQAYAVHALTTAGSDLADEATDFLLEQQCAAGWFRLSFSDPDATDQSCDADSASEPDPDSTSFVLLELNELADDDPTIAAALDRAEAWLADQQKSDGSFGGGPSTEDSNANSTGLAGWALGERGATEGAAKAATWLRALQAHEPVGCATKLTGETGAIAYNAPTLVTGRKSGISDAYQWQLVSAQALPALQWLPTETAKATIAGPAGYQAGGATVTYRVTGAVPGAALCVAVGTTKKLVTAAANGTAAVTEKLPARSTTLSTTVADHAAVTSRAVTKVLGAAKPAIKLSKRKIKRGRKLTVRVAGLAAGEKVTIKVGKRIVKRGTTNAAGVLKTKVKLARKRIKPGKVNVKVTGQFANRTNAKKLKVTR